MCFKGFERSRNKKQSPGLVTEREPNHTACLPSRAALATGEHALAPEPVSARGRLLPRPWERAPRCACVTQ